NKTNIGTFSRDSGGVIANLDAVPEFEDCDVYLLEEKAQNYTVSEPPEILLPGVTVTPSGGWTVSVDNINGSDVVAAIGVPPNGVEIDIPVPTLGSCVLSVTQGKAQSVMADFVNADPTATPPTEAELLVDSQIKFVESPNSQIPC